MILLVDPFPDERDMYAEFLRFEGFDVSICATPSVAVAKAKTASVLAVITRVRQPGHLNGIALTRLLKSDALTQSIPVIVITSHIEGAYPNGRARGGLRCVPDDSVSARPPGC